MELRLLLKPQGASGQDFRAAPLSRQGSRSEKRVHVKTRPIGPIWRLRSIPDWRKKLKVVF